MSDPFADRPFPRGALFGVAALIGFTLLATGLAQWTGFKAVEYEPGAVAKSRDLRFEDREAGLVAVYDTRSNSLVATLAPGTENFIRGVLRGLARERRSRGLDMELPFRVTRYSDGRLTLEDGATGRFIDLQAFGPTNVQSFGHLLDADPIDRAPGPRTSGGRTLASSAGSAE